MLPGRPALILELIRRVCCDTPSYAVGKAVTDGEAEKGIVICGSGIEFLSQRNSQKGVRCALHFRVEMADVDANVLRSARMNRTAFKIVDKG